IKRTFGTQVLSILKGLKKISGIQTEKTALQSESFIRLLLSLSGDVRAVFIKMADTLYNLRIIGNLPVNKQQNVATEAYYLYAPIAHRLGLYHIKAEMEEYSMKFLYPKDYQLIINKLKETTRHRESYIKSFIGPIEQELKKQGFDFEINSRTKSVHSIWVKMNTQKVPFDEVYDLLAIRIILNCSREKEKEDCWKVYSIVSDCYSPNPSRLRDWISAPKRSGYESLHTTVQGTQNKWVEVQIRTRRMDEIAEKGHAAHWRYKETKTTSDSGEWLNSIREILENPDSTSAYNGLARNLAAPSSDIFVFTPTGDLKKLPLGATVLDFAFEIHTNLGFQCTGAKVNGKICPIKHELNNGDEVEIITQKNQKPKKDWLKILKTSRAKAKVKRALKEEEMKEADQGKEIVMRKLKNWKIQFTDENINKIIKSLKYKTPMDLYQSVALEKIDLNRIKDLFFLPVKTETVVPVEEEILQKESDKKPISKKEDFIFLDQNLAGINYTLAHCCNPIFGDEVFGFVTISKGITIHRTNCPNGQDLKSKFDYRILQVKWKESPSGTSFQTTIKISGIDTLGIVNTLSDVISNEMKVNMRSISVESNNGVFEGTIKLYVSDNKNLETLLHKITKIKGVLKASRQD
ncbi:MAG: RelA/SpoT family protein, partial [Bacteroidetes bacterium]|nr:RelA/SpoT family protein [Bacteroidota bacterium]